MKKHIFFACAILLFVISFQIEAATYQGQFGSYGVFTTVAQFALGLFPIPVLTATDQCNAVFYSYSITGATTRSGNTNNASGLFNTGVSTINWTVKDAAGNTSSSSTIVTVTPLPSATITVSNADAFSHLTPPVQ